MECRTYGGLIALGVYSLIFISLLVLRRCKLNGLPLKCVVGTQESIFFYKQMKLIPLQKLSNSKFWMEYEKLWQDLDYCRKVGLKYTYQFFLCKSKNVLKLNCLRSEFCAIETSPILVTFSTQCRVNLGNDFYLVRDVSL